MGPNAGEGRALALRTRLHIRFVAARKRGDGADAVGLVDTAVSVDSNLFYL
jgi:hypothetical protein